MKLHKTIALAIPAFALLAVSSARADTWFVVSTSRCSEVTAGDSAREVRLKMAKDLGPLVLTEAATAEALGGTASGSLEEAERQLSGARMDLFAGNFDRAKRGFVSCDELLQRLPPSQDRWVNIRDVQTFIAWVDLKLENHSQAVADLQKVLLVEPGYIPSPAVFPPSVRELAHQAKAGLKSVRREKLEVKTVPAGLPVYADHRLMGKSPIAIQLPPGQYTVEADFGGARGLPRKVAVSGPSEVTLSRGFEGAIWPGRGPCLDAGDSRANRLNLLTKIAAVTDAQKAVSVDATESNPGERYLAASVVDATTGQEIREAKVKLGPGLSQEDAIAQLASFATTGRVTPALVVEQNHAAPAVAAANAKLLATPSAAHPSSTSSAAAPSAAVEAGPGPSGMRIASYAAAGVGVVGLGVGVVELISSKSSWNDWATQRDLLQAKTGGSVTELAADHDAATRASTISTVGFVVGGAAVVTSAVLFYLSRDAAPGGAQVALLPTRGGGLLQVAEAF